MGELNNHHIKKTYATLRTKRGKRGKRDSWENGENLGRRHNTKQPIGTCKYLGTIISFESARVQSCLLVLHIG